LKFKPLSTCTRHSTSKTALLMYRIPIFLLSKTEWHILLCMYMCAIYCHELYDDFYVDVLFPVGGVVLAYLIQSSAGTSDRTKTELLGRIQEHRIATFERCFPYLAGELVRSMTRFYYAIFRDVTPCAPSFNTLNGHNHHFIHHRPSAIIGTLLASLAIQTSSSSSHIHRSKVISIKHTDNEAHFSISIILPLGGPPIQQCIHCWRSKKHQQSFPAGHCGFLFQSTSEV